MPSIDSSAVGGIPEELEASTTDLAWSFQKFAISPVALPEAFRKLN